MIGHRMGTVHNKQKTSQVEKLARSCDYWLLDLGSNQGPTD